MTRDEVFSKLNDVFRDVFDDESISVGNDTCAEDISGWDSLMHITLISELEDAFHVRFDMKVISKMKNAGEIADVIMEMLK